MTMIYDKNAKKKATNLSINSDLLAKAKANNLNLSKSLEEHLEEILKKKEKENWLKNNKEAINDYNNNIDKSSLFSDNKLFYHRYNFHSK